MEITKLLSNALFNIILPILGKCTVASTVAHPPFVFPPYICHIHLLFKNYREYGSGFLPVFFLLLLVKKPGMGNATTH